MNLQIIEKINSKAYERIREGKCPICNEEIISMEDFKDILSIQEYKISGLCQKCQDKTFGIEELNLRKKSVGVKC